MSDASQSGPSTPADPGAHQGRQAHRRLPVQITDPGHQLLHRGLRTTLVLFPLFAFGTFVVQNNAFTLFAAFGAFAVLALAELGGRRDGRPGAYAALTAASALGIVAGTLASQNTVAGAVVMLIGVFVLQFATVFGGYVAAAQPAVLLAFVLAVMVPAPASQLVAREAGWLLACAISIVVTFVLWPVPDARRISGRYAQVCRGIADVLHAVIVRSMGPPAERPPRGADEPPATTAADVEQMLTAAREWALAQPTRPAGPAERDQALSILSDELARAVTVLDRLERQAAERPTPIAPAQRALAAEVATAFASSADALERGAPPATTAIEVDRARDEHLHALTAWVDREMTDHGDPDPVVATIQRAFPLRVLSLAAVSVRANVAILGGMEVGADPLVTPPHVPDGSTPRATERRAERILQDHLHPGSVPFRNSARAAVALTVALCIAQIGAFEHAFWIVLGALSVLRSNALGTSRTALQAVIGNVLGFVAAAVVLAVGGDGGAVLWVVLPVTVFLAVYTPAAVHFVVGQASFALFVVVLFNLIDPTGLATGVQRVENILIGAAVSIVVALVFWPRGAGEALRGRLAALYRAEAAFLAGAVGNVIAPTPEPTDVRVALARELDADRRQANTAYATYLNERGRKRMEQEDWAAMFSVATALRLTAESIQQLGDLGFATREMGAGEVSDACRSLRRAWQQRMDELVALAEQLSPAPRRPGHHEGTVPAAPLEHRAVAPAIDATGHPARPAVTTTELDRAVAGALAAAHHSDDLRPALGLVFITTWLTMVDRLIDSVRAPAGRARETNALPWYR